MTNLPFFRREREREGGLEGVGEGYIGLRCCNKEEEDGGLWL